MASIGDITYGNDELDAAGIKPWWEVGVSYCNRLLFAISFVAIILIDSREIDATCVPLNFNRTSIFIRNGFIDKKCYFQLWILSRYPGAGGLIGTVFAYMLCTWWTATRPMRNAFRALSKAENLLNEARITKYDISGRESLSEDKTLAIEYAIEYTKLHVDFNDNCLPLIYMVAIVVRLACFCGATVIIYYNFFVQTFEIFTSFECTVSFCDGKQNFHCVSDIGMRGFVFAASIMGMAVFMLVCSAYGAVLAVRTYMGSICCFLAPETNEGPNLLFLKRFCIGATTAAPAMRVLMELLANPE